MGLISHNMEGCVNVLMVSFKFESIALHDLLRNKVKIWPGIGCNTCNLIHDHVTHPLSSLLRDMKDTALVDCVCYCLLLCKAAVCGLFRIQQAKFVYTGYISTTGCAQRGVWHETTHFFDEPPSLLFFGGK